MRRLTDLMATAAATFGALGWRWWTALAAALAAEGAVLAVVLRALGR